jgi:hypothetical protein
VAARAGGFFQLTVSKFLSKYEGLARSGGRLPACLLASRRRRAKKFQALARWYSAKWIAHHFAAVGPTPAALLAAGWRAGGPTK